MAPELPGVCRSPRRPVVARAGLHHWEEPVISGSRGSGAVFFSGCNLHCVFCQNFRISAECRGKEITVERLKRIYRELISQGAHNINLVTPSHFADAISDSLDEALPVPVLWNSNGYDSVETLRRFDGRVQIFLPDFKYSDPELAKRYSGAGDYCHVAEEAILEMFRQTGPFELDDDGLRALLGLWGVRVGGLLSRAETSSCRAVPWEEEKPNPIDLALGRTGGALTLGSPARAFFPAGESLPQTADRPRVRPLLAPRGDGNATGGAVAMAVEREASGTGVRSTRMVVVGDARFAANAMMSTGHDANRLFFLGCIDWLFQRDTAATAERSTPRVLHSAVTPDGWPWVVAAVVVVWPLAILLFTRLLLIRRP